MKYIYLLIDAKIRMIHQIIIANQCCNAFSVYGVCIITLVLSIYQAIHETPLSASD